MNHDDPKPLSGAIGEALERVRSKYAKAPVAAEASERQRRRAQQERIERMRKAARDPALGLPQGQSMLARALGKPVGRVAVAMHEAYEFARGDERRTCTLLVGSNPGTGKTTGAQRVILTHAAKGESALYVRAPLLPHIRNHATAALYDQARSVDLLVVDELGMEPDAATIINIVLERHDNERVTFLLGNLAAKEMVARYQLLADPRMRSRFRGLVKSGLARPVLSITDRDFRGGDDAFVSSIEGGR